jgi:fermentation-respiration switch protein FrsA (DUF1100 family)
MNAAGPDPRRGPGPVFFRRPLVIASGVLLVVITGGTLAATWLIQRFATFPPAPRGAEREAALAEAGGERVWLDAAGARVEAWYLPPRNGRGAAALLLYSHGIRELIDMHVAQFDRVRAMNIGVLKVEYPGYGRSSGAPSEASLTAALVAGFDWAARDPRIDARRIVGYGRSLGGGAIAQLAARRPLAALVLESTFANFEDVVMKYGVPRSLLINHFDTRAVLERFPGPVLLLHGTRDRTFDDANARVLAAASKHATLRLLDCGHADCPPQWELLRSFLAQNGICRAPDPEVSHEDDC